MYEATAVSDIPITEHRALLCLHDQYSKQATVHGVTDQTHMPITMCCWL